MAQSARVSRRNRRPRGFRATARGRLDVSRIEARRLTVVKRPVDLPALVSDVVARVQAITVGHPVDLEVAGSVPPVEADPVRIEQVLTNLLSNAAKYGTPGTAITVRVQHRDDEDVVAVTNLGAGITPEEYPTLFSRFYRASSARNGRQEGLGLGLYISHGIVEAHAGRIWAESIPGQTTTFFFALPLTGG
ncbi:MAG TPA: ATP-binding protein [Chloroflexota bacterium]|nr:ATP-binding protein [Chloroflexota bacterium]